MSKQQHLALLCGGRSIEHEVSLISANFIYRSVDKTLYHVELLYIDKQGRWFWMFDPEAFSEKQLVKGLM